jgi:phage shock protein PspC (stress-responsive transcriptional regulator)
MTLGKEIDMLREYRGFSAICVIVGLFYAAYAAYSGSGLFSLCARYVGTDATSLKLTFIVTALVAGAIVAIPLFIIARLAGINIRDKKPEAAK